MSAAAEPDTDDHLPEAWINTLWPDGLESGEWLSIFAAADGNRKTLWSQTAAELGETITPYIATHDLWLGCATRNANLGSKRGGATDCVHIPGLWLDVDVNGPNHSSTDYPPDVETAEQILEQFPLPASVIIHSGGGLQAWWLLDEPAALADHPELLDAWGHTWTHRFEQAGYKLDSVWDAARIMRIPGTHNHKTDVPQAVTIHQATPGARYGLDDIDQWLTTPEPPQKPSEAPRIPYIGPARPGDAFNQQNSGAAVLDAAGWEHVYTDRQGDQHYKHPTATADTSATVYADDGHTTIWTDTYPNLEPRRPYDPFGLYAALHHHSDWSEATRTLSEHGYGTRPITDQETRALLTQPDPNTRPHNIPHRIYQQRPHLATIQQAAHARGRSPDAVLGNALARIAAHTSHNIALPAIVGSYASLNVIHGIVGPSGAGKSTSTDIAHRLIQPTTPTNLDTSGLDNRPLGSGEGLIDAYHTYETDQQGDKPEKRQTRYAALFHTDEIDQLAQQASRSGSTLMPTLRTAWSGGMLGQTNATADRTRHLPAHKYRFALIVGVQPEKAGGLVSDAAGGTPQRFTWFNAIDTDIPEPDQRPEMPDPIRWTPPLLDAHHIVDIDGLRHGLIGVPDRIAEQIAWNDHQRNTGARHSAPGESHLDLARLKTAALLAILDERPTINDEDWDIADVITQTSAAIYRMLEQTQQDIASREDEKYVRRAVAVATGVAVQEDEQAMLSAVNTSVKRARKMAPDVMTRRDASRAQTKKGRGVSIDDALDHAVAEGHLITTEGGWTVPK